MHLPAGAPYLVILEEGPELLQSIEAPIIVISECFFLKVIEHFQAKLLLHSIAVESEETLQPIPASKASHKDGSSPCINSYIPVSNFGILQCQLSEFLIHFAEDVWEMTQDISSQLKLDLTQFQLVG